VPAKSPESNSVFPSAETLSIVSSCLPFIFGPALIGSFQVPVKVSKKETYTSLLPKVFFVVLAEKYNAFPSGVGVGSHSSKAELIRFPKLFTLKLLALASSNLIILEKRLSIFGNLGLNAL